MGEVAPPGGATPPTVPGAGVPGETPPPDAVDTVAGAPVSATVAVVLPRSGPPYLQQYADLLLEGIRIAARQSRHDVRLLVLDDAGLPELDSAMVAAALDSGAVAVIGPLLTPGVASAARGSAGSIVVVSPTAAEVPAFEPAVYTLNAVDVRGARSLAEYAWGGGMASAAVLYPAQEDFSRQAWEFARRYQDLGGRIATMVPYDSGTTTFGTHIGRVMDSHPDIVYLPLSPQDVEIVAPQLAYYGLRDSTSIVVLGNESWADEQVRRLVATQFTASVVTATPRPRAMGETAWEDFVALYEATHRRSLDNPFPALGYDAMALVLNALAGGPNTPQGLAARFSATRAYRGATGVLSVEGGTITRAPFIYLILDGALVPAPPADLLRPLPALFDTTAAPPVQP